MKIEIKNLRKEQQVWAIVEENLAFEELIVNFGGDLIRVQNQTGKKFRPGQRVLLKVDRQAPLLLKLISPAAKNAAASLKLDVTV